MSAVVVSESKRLYCGAARAVGKAVHRYLRALDAQLVAGAMCRRLMKVSLWIGRRSEARGVYQRFSQTLCAKLDVPPTQATLSLYHDIPNL